MKTKSLFTIILMLFASFLIYAQNPNGYCGVTLQDSIDIAANRYEATVARIDDADAPEIDGIMDRVWYCSSSPLTMKQEPGHDYDPNFDVDVRLLYDSSWLYVAVNILHDNDLVFANTDAGDVDRVELMFQNTWGGRKDGTYDHCNEANWWWWYWAQDGDRKWNMPMYKDYLILYIDQDINDACATPHPAKWDVEAPGWLTLGVLKQVLYEVDTTELSDGTYRITYEMAFHLRNWLKYDDFGGTTVPVEGHDFGLEVSIRDVDSDGMGGFVNAGEYNMTDPADPSDLAWCTALATSKMTFGPKLELPDTCQPPVDICNEDPLLCIIDNVFETQAVNPVRVFPNPVKNILTVDMDNVSALEIINIMGHVMLKQENDSNELNVSSLSNGVYFLKAYENGLLVGMEKFIKE